MTPQSIVSPEDQRVTFVELFFDLVFVFSVTQVVGLLHGSLDAMHIGQAVLVFWLVWWAWTQLTWALNSADTTHHYIELGTLLTTAAAFFMAIAVPEAFAGKALAFAIPYVLVRVLGLTLYAWVASVADSTQHAAVRTFSIVSIGGLGAVLIGAVIGGDTQYWLWGFAIVLDVIAAAVGGQQEGWNLHPDHFAERHGLFVIIALGESLIVAAGGVTGVQWTPAQILVAVLAVAVTCGLWWTYFHRAKGRLDRELEARTGTIQTKLARDVFSLTHFPMICGIIAYAVAVEAAVEHPGDAFDLAHRLVLAAGVLLFVGGMAVAMWQALGRMPVVRTATTFVTAGIVVGLAEVPPAVSLIIVLAGTAVIAIAEHRGHESGRGAGLSNAGF